MSETATIRAVAAATLAALIVVDRSSGEARRPTCPVRGGRAPSASTCGVSVVLRRFSDPRRTGLRDHLRARHEARRLSLHPAPAPGGGESTRATLYLRRPGLDATSASGLERRTERRTRAGMLLPHGVMWDQDDWFTGRSEGPETITKFRIPEGITWTERRGTPVTRRGRVRTPSGTAVWPTPMRPTIVVSEHLGPDACRISGDGAKCQGSEHGHSGTDGHRGAWTSPVDQHKDQDWNRHHQLGQAEDDQRGSPTQRRAKQRHQLEVSATDAPPSAHDHHEENESAGNGHSQHGLGQCLPPSRGRGDERVGKADKRQEFGIHRRRRSSTAMTPSTISNGSRAQVETVPP